MASSLDVAAMAKRAPAGYLDLFTAVNQGAHPSISIIGVVTDYMPPKKSMGSDFMMTFTLVDNSMLPYGLRVKFFRRTLQEMPAVQGTGDVVILRKIKLSTYSGSFTALSSQHTEHIVFQRDTVVTPDFRIRYAVEGAHLQHTKSDGANNPTIAEQQWVITLSDYWKKMVQIRSDAPVAPLSMRSIAPPSLPAKPDFAKPPNPQLGSTEIRSSKFVLVKDLPSPQGGLNGTYVDMAGEVIGVYENRWGSHDLSICDYTSNALIYSSEISDRERSESEQKLGPDGKMVFKIELAAPHGPAAIRSLSPGSFAMVKNVFIKYNKLGNLVGSLYVDQYYRDKVLVYPLNEASPIYAELLARKNEYATSLRNSAVSKRNRNCKHETKKQRKARLKREREEAQKRKNPNDMDITKDDDEHVVSEGDDNDDEEEEAETEEQPFKRVRLSTSVVCDFPDIRLSTFADIVDNPNRMYAPPAMPSSELPFINVNHHVRAKVVDFYPHERRNFTTCVKTGSGFRWEWDFWLVLSPGSVHDDFSKCINVNVTGRDAEDLLGGKFIAQNLSTNNARLALQRLEDTLFLLWGELAAKKDAFLHAHAHIKPDEDFSALKYNISVDNLPFEGCIAEIGIRIPSSETLLTAEPEGHWTRMYKLFGTRIQP